MTHDLRKNAHAELFRRVGWKKLGELVAIARRALNAEDSTVVYDRRKRTLTVHNTSRLPQTKRELRDFFRSKSTRLLKSAKASMHKLVKRVKELSKLGATPTFSKIVFRCSVTSGNATRRE